VPFVRWRGDPDPVEVNFSGVTADIAAGKYTKEDVWAYNRKRQIVMEGVTARILGPSEGLSRFYQWGPDWGSFTIHVTDADWKRIQAMPEVNTFVLAIEQ